ncbi:hypothetical protein M1O52_00110 [Dehalococcoidia bacterium]|nr:hypothetical protein [Dehalococcoidia bacterium]
MRQRPSLRGIPEDKILEARQLSNGKWIFKIANKKGLGDFRVSVFDPATQTRLTPSYAHFVIDLYGKLCRNEKTTPFLLKAIEEIYYGSKAHLVLEKLNKSNSLAQFERLPGYSVEYTLHALEFIFAQEDVNWERDFVQLKKPLPKLRTELIRQGFLTKEEAEKKGSAIAMHCLRRVIRDKIHVVAAMHEVRLRI